MLLEAQATGQERVTDEPEGEVVAAVEVEAAEAVELVEEVVAEALGVVEDDERDDAALIGEEPCSSYAIVSLNTPGLSLYVWDSNTQRGFCPMGE
ncbi:MAG: hypothetical protein R3B09_00220 [Nannocystaceae bacterium]